MGSEQDGNDRFIYDKTIKTAIYQEDEDDNNPYLSKTHYLHGYEIFDLLKNASFVESLLLLYVGEIPLKEHAKIFELLMVALMNPGPRHPAVKAAMVAGVSKTNTEHLLPIGLSVLGGSSGGKEVEAAMVFIKNKMNLCAKKVAEKLLDSVKIDEGEGVCLLCPGFGASFSSMDPYCIALASHLSKEMTDLQKFPAFQWTQKFVNRLSSNNLSWLKTGLVAAILIDVGISSRQSVGIFQLLCAPGIIAQSVEQSHMPITSMPMLEDEHHHFDTEEDETV